MANLNPNNPHYHHPLTPTDMEQPLEDDIDPESLKVITNILGSSSGRRWLESFIIECVGSSHIGIMIREGGQQFNGYIKAYNTPYWAGGVNITIKPEDSWFKKWIKRQLM